MHAGPRQSGTVPLVGVPSSLPGDLAALARIRTALRLTDAELTRLAGGQPSSAIVDILAVIELLERKLRPGLLPSVARRPVPGKPGRTLLDELASEPAGTRARYEAAFTPDASA